MTQIDPPRFARWLTEPMWRNRGTYLRVALAAVMVNLFGLVSSLFSMTVYDRVVPNDAFASLTALSIGLAIVLVFDFVLRILRAYFVDLAGADIDRRIGGAVFARLIALRLDQKRRSTGALTNMMRELETMRDFFASATLVSIVDVPFVILTLVVIALIGGVIVLVPLAMVPVVLGAGLLTRPALDRLSQRAMNDGMAKQTVLVEALGALEMVKSTGAGPLLLARWHGAMAGHADSALRQRLVSTVAVTIASTANMLSYAGVVIAGVFLIADRSLTTGGLVACSILAGRAVQPLAQVAALLTRLSATRTAYRQIQAVLDQPDERPADTALRPLTLRGAIELKQVDFRYPGAAQNTLTGVDLKIEPGERVALIGRVGSGKSTIARLILGLYHPDSGQVLVDGAEVRQYDPAVLRARIGTALQDPALLSGTVRENITLGRAGIDEAAMLSAATLAGVHGFMAGQASGYDLMLADRGEGLSGGQRQSIALARALAGNPSVLLFDEPTSAMDPQTEMQLLARLDPALEGRSFLLITHRPALLRLVRRVVVVDGGRIVADGPRDEILQKLQRTGAAQ